MGPTLLLCGLRCTSPDDGPFCTLLINPSDCVSYSVSSTSPWENPSLPQGRCEGENLSLPCKSQSTWQCKKHPLWLAEVVNRIFCRHLAGSLVLQPCTEPLTEMSGVSLPLLLCSWSQIKVSHAFLGLFCCGRGVCCGWGAGRVQEKQRLLRHRCLSVLYLELMS